MKKTVSLVVSTMLSTALVVGTETQKENDENLFKVTKIDKSKKNKEDIFSKKLNKDEKLLEDIGKFYAEDGKLDAHTYARALLLVVKRVEEDKQAFFDFARALCSQYDVNYVKGISTFMMVLSKARFVNFDSQDQVQQFRESLQQRYGIPFAADVVSQLVTVRQSQMNSALDWAIEWLEEHA